MLISVNTIAQKDSLVVQYDQSVLQLKKFDQKKLEKYRNKKEFNYTVIKNKTSVFVRIWRWFKRIIKKFFTWLFGVKKAGSVFAVFLRIIPYLVLVILLFFLIKFFLKVNISTIISGKTNNAKVTLTEEEEIIKNKDISLLIQKAIEQKNYRLAVRYYYLQTLQKLQEKELIEWEQQKTNEDYIKEIKEKQLNTKFKGLTYLYDFVWYGNFEINEIEFNRVALNFKNLTKSIA